MLSELGVINLIVMRINAPPVDPVEGVPCDQCAGPCVWAGPHSPGQHPAAHLQTREDGGSSTQGSQ